jgi:hypothetical protein
MNKEEIKKLVELYLAPELVNRLGFLNIYYYLSIIIYIFKFQLYFFY